MDAGQLVSSMRMDELKHGFLSTYHVSVFVRRVDNFRLELIVAAHTVEHHKSPNPEMLDLLLNDGHFRFHKGLLPAGNLDCCLVSLFSVYVSFVN